MGQVDTASLIVGVMDSVRAAFFDLDRWTDDEMCSSTRFSSRIFPEFRKLAENMHYDARFTASEPRNYEFLYDVSFLVTSGSFNERNGYFYSQTPLKRTVLVLECEWSPREEEIIYDFSKLLLARADLRCLIFYRNSQDLLDSCIYRAKAAIAAFEQSDSSDRYLLCGLYARRPTFTLLDGNGQDVQLPVS